MTYELYVPSKTEAEDFANYFQAQASQTGFGFVGSPYQRGAGLGSIFSGLFRSFAPFAKSALKSVGKAALNTGLQVASDALQGRNVGEALEEHGRGAAQGLIGEAVEGLNKRSQEGEGLGAPPAKRSLKSIKGRKKSEPHDVLSKRKY